jgi:sec-independent protein translocase protein TatA
VFSHFAFLDVGTPELLLILAIALLLFGGKKLPELSRSLGESIAEFKKSTGSITDVKKEVKDSLTGTDSKS